MEQLTVNPPASARVIKTLSFRMEEWAAIEKSMAKANEHNFIATCRTALGLQAIRRGVPVTEIPESMKENV